ncbi:MAG: elongation factor P [Candidatus Kerfeldbacteria bacterium]|nr:elongation factor P [Candidatus Kerfeldbacteria bacterium]
MLGMNDLRTGVVFKMNDQPYLIMWSNFLRMAQRKPVRQAKIKNLITGKILELSFKLDDRFEEADVQRRKATYLYRDDSAATFMDAETYDQTSIDFKDLGSQINFLVDGAEVTLLVFENKTIGVDLPKKVELKVTETADVVRGDTAQGSVTKEATLETGATVKVPMFIKTGDKVRINTETGEYVERA